ncbi:hypothetical protein GCM10010129_40950 [Streptomyces fumigatiscleroticus]|nr:hypothetical protein GCM10010129_40950 [Streptomyces fumigatiscleroticus]
MEPCEVLYRLRYDLSPLGVIQSRSQRLSEVLGFVDEVETVQFLCLAGLPCQRMAPNYEDALSVLRELRTPEFIRAMFIPEHVARPATVSRGHRRTSVRTACCG